MKTNDLQQFTKVMGVLVKVFCDPTYMLDKTTLEIYFQVFKNLSIEDFSRAAEEAIKKRVYSGLPKPAELLKYLFNEDRAALTAWMELEEKGFTAIATRDEVTVKVWKGLSRRYKTQLEAEIHHLQREFERRYKAAMKDKNRPFASISDKVQGLLPEILKDVNE
jgi:hypothetical protein